MNDTVFLPISQVWTRKVTLDTTLLSVISNISQRHRREMQSSSQSPQRYIIISQIQIQNHHQTSITLIHTIQKFTKLLFKIPKIDTSFIHNPLRLTNIDRLSSTLSPKCYLSHYHCLEMNYIDKLLSKLFIKYNRSKNSKFLT